MNSYPHTLILRHRRENLKKCSLRGLEAKSDLEFYTYPKDTLPSLTGYILLTIDAPVLSRDDANKGIFLIDGTWKYAQVMYNQLDKPHTFYTRSLPNDLKTAYPRKQDDCLDPERGLASVEALYAAYSILGRDAQGLLDHYFWKDAFLKKNASLLS